MSQASTKQAEAVRPDPLGGLGAVAARVRGRAGAGYRDFKLLTKPRIMMMVVITAVIGAMVGHAGQSVSAVASWWSIGAAVGGAALACLGAAALNQAMERDADARMHRTRNRPVAAGRMSVGFAVSLGVVLVVVGCVVQVLFSNVLTAALTAATAGAYVLVYTPMKRWSIWSTPVGAAPGAMPPVIGYAAATGGVDVAAGALFAIMFAWQMPHFLAIAWLYREDYARGGFAMLPVIDPSGRSTFRHMLAWSAVLLPLGLAPTLIGSAGLVYAVGALAAGLVFAGLALRLAMRRRQRDARLVFIASLIYLPLVMTLVVLDGGG